ncbi:MAG TPA: SGNH/GDSL hydrolase family protein [Capsulimonadaceae bacterium]|jgi:lysophospholipase L1-like esterase
MKTIGISSPAFVFSPGNWTGDDGRVGDKYRQSWNSGAYFRVTWSTTSASPVARLLLDTTQYAGAVSEIPQLTYCIDGRWHADIVCDRDIEIGELTGPGSHQLAVYFQNSEQANRWGTSDQSGHCVLRVTGLAVDDDGEPVAGKRGDKWALMVGDSITEGCGTTGNLDVYSYLVGQSLRMQGYEYCVSACGYSGWLQYGDRPEDVLPYYFVSGSSDGVGGVYDPAKSRWNKIDGAHSLLDSTGRLSGYGGTGQEPSLITINFGTNDFLWGSDMGDMEASITQSLAALRGAAPSAKIFVIIPFGQYVADHLKTAVARYQATNPTDNAVAIIDLGADTAAGLVDDGYYSGLHPNMRGHAVFAAQILGVILGG